MQLLLLIFVFWSVYPRYFKRDKVIHDINYTAGVMEDVHPDLFAMISKADLTAHTDSIENTLPEKISEAGAYRVFSEVFAPVHDGHTGCRWNNIYTLRGSGLFRKILPLRLIIVGNKIFVTKDYQG